MQHVPISQTLQNLLLLLAVFYHNINYIIPKAWNFWNIYSKSKYFKDKLKAYNAAHYNGGLNVRLL
jgi:succinate dehydrogenase/fumarate reductase cytochrome b subunit